MPQDPISLEGAAGLEPATGLAAVSYGPSRREPLPTTEAVPLTTRQDPPNFVRLIFDPGVSHTVGDGAPTASNYAVTVSDGVVCEHVTDAGYETEALKYHKCPSRLGEDGFPYEFPIEIDEAIYIRVVDDGTGHIGLPDGSEFDDAVDLVVMPDTQMSVNLIDGLQDGLYYYRLASLKTVNDVVTLVPYLSGSHIHHLSGFVCDAVLEDCSGDPGDPGAEPPVPSTPNQMIQRLSFNRGVIVGLNDSYETRPLATVNSVEQVSPCT